MAARWISPAASALASSTRPTTGTIAAALRDAIHGRTAQEVYEHYVHEVAQNRWTIQDGAFRLGTGSTYREDAYPNSYAFAFRIDGLLAMDNPAIIGELEQHTGLTIYTLDHLVDALNLAIDEFQDTGRLAAIKIGMAYQRDLVVGDPTHAEAEAAFVKIRNRKSYYGGIRQYAGAVDAVESRRLGDYMFHRLIQRAADEACRCRSTPATWRELGAAHRHPGAAPHPDPGQVPHGAL